MSDVEYTDHPFDPSHHGPDTNGAKSMCTECRAAPVVSRQVHDDRYEDGWWTALCADHAVAETHYGER